MMGVVIPDIGLPIQLWDLKKQWPGVNQGGAAILREKVGLYLASNVLYGTGI